MATNVVEKYDARKATFRSGNWAYTRVYQIVTDDPTLEGSQIKDLAGIPQAGELYEFDSLAMLETLDISQKVEMGADNCNGVWIATAVWSYKENEDNGGEDDPLEMPALFTYAFENNQKPFTHDPYSDPPNIEPVTNSAGKPFDPPVMIDDSRPIMIVVQNEETFSFSTAIQYQDAVNNAAWTVKGDTWDQYQAKVRQISAREVLEGDLTYFEVTYEFAFQREGWNPVQILDQGYQYLLGVLGWVNIKDQNGDFVNEPALLKDGRVLLPSEDPEFLPYSPYKPMDFGAFVFRE